MAIDYRTTVEIIQCVTLPQTAAAPTFTLYMYRERETHRKCGSLTPCLQAAIENELQNQTNTILVSVAASVLCRAMHDCIYYIHIYWFWFCLWIIIYWNANIIGGNQRQLVTVEAMFKFDLDCYKMIHERFDNEAIVMNGIVQIALKPHKHPSKQNLNRSSLLI